MQSPTHDKRAAMALATAAVIGDRAAARYHGCSTRSIQRWRATCEDDEELASAVVDAREKVEAKWQDEVPRALTAAMDFLARAAENLSTTDPEAVAAMAVAFEKVANCAVAQRVLDERCAAQARNAGAQSLALVAGSTGSDRKSA